MTRRSVARWTCALVTAALVTPLVPPYGGTASAAETRTAATKAVRLHQTDERGARVAGSRAITRERPLRPAVAGAADRLRRTLAASTARTSTGVGTKSPSTSLTSTATTKQAPTTSTVAATRSGLPWASGVRAASAAEAQAFEAWRGRPVDVVLGFTARASWSDVVAPSWLFQRHAGQPYRHIYSVPPFPEISGVSLAECASGAYNRYWRQFGQNIKAAGEDDSVVRLGWEFNGTWYVWKASNPAQFAKCWRQIHRSVEAYAPRLQWDWSVNRGRSGLDIDPTQAYPGDAYVDYVGVDSYDHWMPANVAGGWESQRDGVQGLEFWAGFARERGKKLSVTEWGVSHNTMGGGDDPVYITRMHEWLTANAPLIGYEVYFESDGTPSVYQHRLTTATGTDNPLNAGSAAEYRRLFGTR